MDHGHIVCEVGKDSQDQARRKGYHDFLVDAQELRHPSESSRLLYLIVWKEHQCGAVDFCPTKELTLIVQLLEKNLDNCCVIYPNALTRDPGYKPVNRLNPEQRALTYFRCHGALTLGASRQEFPGRYRKPRRSPK